MTVSGMLPASRVMGTRRAEEAMDVILWPWLARMTQSEGISEVGEGGLVRDGLGFMEKRCLALSVTARRMSAKVIWRDLRRE